MGLAKARPNNSKLREAPASYHQSAMLDEVASFLDRRGKDDLIVSQIQQLEGNVPGPRMNPLNI